MNNGINWYMAWLWIKVRAAVRRVGRAASQAKPRPSAHTGTTSPVVDDLSTGADVETIRRLYASGIITRAQFEEGMAMTLLRPDAVTVGIDPSGDGAVVYRRASDGEITHVRPCPCGGKHFPADDSCRWCECHDPRSEHHGMGALGGRGLSPWVRDMEIQSPVRPSEGPAEAPVSRETGYGAPDAPEGRQGAPVAHSGCSRDTDGDGNCGQPMCPECGSRVVGEHDPDYNDLQDYLEGDSRTADAAAQRLDQRAVDEAQLSPGAYRLQWGGLPVITFNAHQFWCGRRDHDFMACPFWGEE